MKKVFGIVVLIVANCAWGEGRPSYFEILKSQFPERLSQTGLFTDLSALTTAPGMIPYDVIFPLWSDNAEKARWLAVPPGQKIHFNAEQTWEFPEGSLIVKNFAVPGIHDLKFRLETRVLVKRPGGFQGITYRWNPEQTEATRVTTTTDVLIETASPVNPTQTWTFPSQSQCLMCHASGANEILGVDTLQLNHTVESPTVPPVNQLTWLNALGIFDRDIGNPAQYRSYRSPREETNETLTERARTYLQVNCAHCHSPGGMAPGGLDLRAGIPASDMQAVGSFAADGDLGIPNAYRINPGSKETSVLWLRMGRTDSFRMPKVNSHLVDEKGLKLIGDWIDAGAP